MAVADGVYEKTVGEQDAVREPWKTFLDKEIRSFESGSVDEEATIIIRDVLEAGSVSVASSKEAALRLDKLEQNIRLRCDPIQQIVDVALRISYHDEKQDRLIQLLKELVDLSRPGYEYGRDLSGVLEKAWNGRYPSRGIGIDDPEEAEATLRTKCDQWPNYSAFKARTLAAGICANYENWSFKAPANDIATGLSLQGDTKEFDMLTDCTLMVAAQYILLAGEVIRNEFTKPEAPAEGWNQDHWKLWTEQFRKASNWECVKEETRLAATEAHNKMVVLWPELFADSKAQAGQEAEDSGLEVQSPGN